MPHPVSEDVGEVALLRRLGRKIGMGDRRPNVEGTTCRDACVARHVAGLC